MVNICAKIDWSTFNKSYSKIADGESAHTPHTHNVVYMWSIAFNTHTQFQHISIKLTFLFVVGVVGTIGG